MPGGRPPRHPRGWEGPATPCCPATEACRPAPCYNAGMSDEPKKPMRHVVVFRPATNDQPPKCPKCGIEAGNPVRVMANRVQQTATRRFACARCGEAFEVSVSSRTESP